MFFYMVYYGDSTTIITRFYQYFFFVFLIYTLYFWFLSACFFCKKILFVFFFLLFGTLKTYNLFGDFPFLFFCLWYFFCFPQSPTSKKYLIFILTYKNNKNSNIPYETTGFSCCVFPVSFCCAIVSTLNNV